MMLVRHARRGFTLVELMLVMAIMGIVTTNMLQLFQTQFEIYVKQEDVVEAQEDGRLVMEMVLADIRMAGYMVPRVAGVASRDGGANGSDALCISDWSVIDDTALVNATDHLDRAEITTNLGAGAGSLILAAGQLDIDNDGDDDFAVGQGIIIGHSTGSHCALITAIAGDTISFSPVTPAGFLAPVASARAVPARVYQVTAAGLRRDTTVLSSQVEDLQVEFGVDVDENDEIGAGEFPIHDLDGFNPGLVRRVRLSLVTRGPNEDTEVESSGRPGSANRSGSGPDGFRRRTFATSMMPRNLR